MAVTPEPAASSPRLPFGFQPGEQVLRVCRRHWLFLWPRLLFMALVAVLPPVVVGLLVSAAGAYHGAGAKVFWVGAGIYLLFWGLRLFLTWYKYNHDIWVITNQRLVDSIKPNPFSMTISTADLVNLQDITVERSGILRTIFDFGDIICQTAAEKQEFRLSGIPDPRSVQALIDGERDRERLRYRA